ncbi:MAG: 5-formyltetrahydrofolate cyclo-ligase [Bacteroidota bacterium]|jgi:5-formyltetrahydrofolate cyclo-ligase
MKTKSSIRQSQKLLRDALPKKEIAERSSRIFSNLLLVPEFFRADCVHIYVSSKNNEVDTHQLIRWLLKEKKRVVVPIVNSETKMMEHSEIFSLSELHQTSLGIFEPTIRRIVKPSALQVIIVPALAVDRKGNRIGFGGGFYDRFLATTETPSIVPAYNFQVVQDIPAESFDRKVSYIVTEDGVIKC